MAELQHKLEELDAAHRQRAATVDAALAVEHLRRLRLQRALDPDAGTGPAEEYPDTEVRAPNPRLGDALEHGLVPGQSWHYPRGDLVLLLTSRPPGLLRSDRWSLLTPDPPAVLVDAVRTFLAVRPDGGRVWVDDDGDACTFRDGELVYLGRLPVDVLNRQLATAADSPQRSAQALAGPPLSLEAVLDRMRSTGEPRR